MAKFFIAFSGREDDPKGEDKKIDEHLSTYYLFDIIGKIIKGKFTLTLGAYSR